MPDLWTHGAVESAASTLVEATDEYTLRFIEQQELVNVGFLTARHEAFNFKVAYQLF